MSDWRAFSVGRLVFAAIVAAVMLLPPLKIEGQQPPPAVQMVGDTGEGAKYWARWRGPSGQGIVQRDGLSR